jgi:hypothetical protein
MPVRRTATVGGGVGWGWGDGCRPACYLRRDGTKGGGWAKVWELVDVLGVSEQQESLSESELSVPPQKHRLRIAKQQRGVGWGWGLWDGGWEKVWNLVDVLGVLPEQQDLLSESEPPLLP